ncbi:MAG: hypothetical protein V1824_02465, partial [archaeon]
MPTLKNSIDVQHLIFDLKRKKSFEDSKEKYFYYRNYYGEQRSNKVANNLVNLINSGKIEEANKLFNEEILFLRTKKDIGEIDPLISSIFRNLKTSYKKIIDREKFGKFEVIKPIFVRGYKDLYLNICEDLNSLNIVNLPSKEVLKGLKLYKMNPLVDLEAERKGLIHKILSNPEPTDLTGLFKNLFLFKESINKGKEFDSNFLTFGLSKSENQTIYFSREALKYKFIAIHEFLHLILVENKIGLDAHNECLVQFLSTILSRKYKYEVPEELYKKDKNNAFYVGIDLAYDYLSTYWTDLSHLKQFIID